MGGWVVVGVWVGGRLGGWAAACAGGWVGWLMGGGSGTRGPRRVGWGGAGWKNDERQTEGRSARGQNREPPEMRAEIAIDVFEVHAWRQEQLQAQLLLLACRIEDDVLVLCLADDHNSDLSGRVWWSRAG